jgi:hypothetical protein
MLVESVPLSYFESITIKNCVILIHVSDLLPHHSIRTFGKAPGRVPDRLSLRTSITTVGIFTFNGDLIKNAGEGGDRIEELGIDTAAVTFFLIPLDDEIITKNLLRSPLYFSGVYVMLKEARCVLPPPSCVISLLSPS